MRTYAPSPTVADSHVPLYLRGAWGLGAAAQAVAATSGAAGKLLPLLSTASWAGPVGAAVAIVGALIAGFWAAHAARVKGAKDENTHINSAVTAFDQSLRAIFDAANSSDPQKYIPADQAITFVQQTRDTFWQMMAPYMSGPGRADTSGFGANCGQVNPADPCSGMIGGHKCDKACTAGCCVGCQDIEPTVWQAIQVLQAGGGTVKACQIFGSRYGASSRGSYTLTYAPNPPSVAASVTGAIESLLPSGASTPGAVGGSSLLPLIAMGAAAFLMLR